MEHIIGIRVFDARRGEAAFMCWGRIGDPVDPTVLLSRVRAVLPLMGFRHVTDVAVCGDLGELQAYQYFYEALFQFAAEYAEVLRGAKSLGPLMHDDEALRRSLYLLGPRRDVSGS